MAKTHESRFAQRTQLASLSLMFRRLFIAVCFLLPAACIFAGPPPGLALSTGAHPTHPIMLQSLTINGVELNRMEMILAGAWADPKGENTSLLSMPIDPDDSGRLHLTARWIDLTGNIGYSGQMTAAMSDLTVQNLSRRTGDVIVLFGPDGYLELSTSAPPDANGQYNGRIITTTCAVPGAGLPQDNWVWQRLRDYPLGYGGPAPDMGCEP